MSVSAGQVETTAPSVVLSRPRCSYSVVGCTVEAAALAEPASAEALSGTTAANRRACSSALLPSHDDGVRGTDRRPSSRPVALSRPTVRRSPPLPLPVRFHRRGNERLRYCGTNDFAAFVEYLAASTSATGLRHLLLLVLRLRWIV